MATKEERDRILNIISKLAAVAAPDSGAFQGEMENAAARIQELMDKYTISWAEVQVKQSERQQREDRNQFVPFAAENMVHGFKQWHWDLARLITRITHTKHYSQGPRMKFFGPETNAQAASALFSQWSVIIEAMSQEAYNKRFFELADKYGRGAGLMKRVPAHERTTFFKPSWLQGCVDGMSKVITEKERDRAKQQTTALALYEGTLLAEYRKAFPRMRSARTPKYHGYSEAGYERGHKTGSSIDISARGVESKAQQPKRSSALLLKG